MAQSYKVFFNDRTLFLTESVLDLNFSKASIQCFNPTEQEFIEFVDSFNNDSTIPSAAVMLDDSLSELLQRLKLHYKYIQAAGGLVENKDGLYLVIHRLGCWDLPKGKVEKDERIASAAVREVEEECGIENPTIQTQICSTFHTYLHKGAMVLKETFWYKMGYDGDEMPMPQTSENIAIAKWIDKEQIEEILKNTYPSIKEVFQKGIKFN